MNTIVELFSKLLTFYIFNKNLRKKIRNNIKTLMYGYKVIKNAKSIGKGLHINGFSTVGGNCILGDYVNFNGLEVHGSGLVKFGNYFHSGKDCLIITENHVYNGELIPYEKESICREVIIDDFVWLGRRVTILPGTHIGEGAIIQAGAVVHGEIPSCAIAGGNPAKVFKYRDIELFQRNKAENKILDISK